MNATAPMLLLSALLEEICPQVAFEDVENVVLRLAEGDEADTMRLTAIEGNWLLISDGPFTSAFELVVTTRDGESRVISITDSQTQPGLNLETLITNPGSINATLLQGTQDAQHDITDATKALEGLTATITNRPDELQGKEFSKNTGTISIDVPNKPAIKIIKVNKKTNENGEVYFSNLQIPNGSGTFSFYMIEEITPPAGYNRMAAPFYLCIYNDGNIWLGYLHDDEIMKVENELVDAHYYNQLPASYDSTSKSLTLTVGNTPGVELPSIGGPGTSIYTASGLALMGLAFFLLLRRRRERN